MITPQVQGFSTAVGGNLDNSMQRGRQAANAFNRQTGYQGRWGTVPQGQLGHSFGGRGPKNTSYGFGGTSNFGGGNDRNAGGQTSSPVTPQQQPAPQQQQDFSSQDIWSNNDTQLKRNQIASQAFSPLGDMTGRGRGWNIQKQYARPGRSLDQGTMSLGLPAMSNAVAGATRGMQQQTDQDYMQNQQNQLVNEQILGNEQLGLAGNYLNQQGIQDNLQNNFQTAQLQQLMQLMQGLF